jgi:hypothetical protein
MSGNRPPQFSRNFPVSSTRGSRFRQPYADAGHHRMPYHSPRDRDRDRDRDRGRGYRWGGFPLWTGWVGPYLPNYPLFYPDDFDQYDSDQAGYGGQPYSDNAYADQSQQSPYQDAPYPDANGYGNPASYYPAPYGSASPDQGSPGAPYRPSPQLSQQARSPYHPSSGSMAAPVPELPLTVVFKDGRPPEKIHNYLLTSTTLSVLDQQRRDIPVNQIDLAETAKVNREAGVDFQVPGTARP